MTVTKRPTPFGIQSNIRHAFDIGGGKRPQRLEITTTKAAVKVMQPWNTMPRSRLDPVSAMLIGRRGKGKTLGMVCMSWFQKQRYTQFKIPFKVASNFWIEHADILNPDLVQWFNSHGLIDSRARNLFACIDEVGTQFANRRSLSAVNVDFAQVITMMRKLNDEFMFTTQFPQWVDMMVLYQVDWFHMMDGFAGNSKIDVYMFDWWGQYTGRYHRKAWPPQMEDVDSFMTIHNADLMWSKYRSNQVIPPSWAKNRNQVVLSEWGDDYEMDLGDELTPEAQNTMSLGAPKSIDELLERVLGDEFAVKSMLAQAKRLDERIKNVNSFEMVLKEKGWDVEDDGGVKIAFKP